MSSINLRRKNPVSHIWRTKDPGNGSLSSYPTTRKHPFQKGTNNGRREVVHHPTGKLFSQGHNTKYCYLSQPKKYHQLPWVLQKIKD